MSTSLSPLLAPLLSSAAMRAVCDDVVTLQHMLDFEAALARAEAATGVIPGSAVPAIEAACSASRFDMAGLAEAATRAGNLAIDASGTLRTANGLAVLGNSGPISLPPLDKIEVGADGTISTISLGQTAETMVETNRIKLVKPDIKNLVKGTDGLFRQRDGLPAEVDASVRVASNVLEGSNVNAMSEFTQIISLARQYDMQLKLMKAAEDNSSASAQLLQMS